MSVGDVHENTLHQTENIISKTINLSKILDSNQKLDFLFTSIGLNISFKTVKQRHIIHSAKIYRKEKTDKRLFSRKPKQPH